MTNPPEQTGDPRPLATQGLWRVGLWFDFGPAGPTVSHSIEVWARSSDEATSEALSEVSAGRLGVECAKVVPSIESCVQLTHPVERPAPPTEAE